MGVDVHGDRRKRRPWCAWLSAGLSMFFLSCGSFEANREAFVVNAIVRADMPLLRSRPALVAGKYARMAADPYAFWRATVPLFRLDAQYGEVGRTRFPVTVLPVAQGDAHIENFGTLEGSDGVLTLEANDFDGADRLPYHWDLRRLTVGLAIAAALSNAGDEAARVAAVEARADIVEGAARSYAEAMRAFADGAPRDAFLAEDTDAPLIESLFRRAARDQGTGEELDELTEMVAVEEGGLPVRRFLRGVLDEDEPTEQFLDVPTAVREALPDMLAAYQRTLLAPPEFDPAAGDFFQVLDIVRHHGAGVASWPRVRCLILVRGPSDAPDDDVILELKELADSGASGGAPIPVASTVSARVLSMARAAWSRPDAEPLWGVAELMGMPVQIRREAEMHKTLRVRRLEDEEGTPEAIRAVGVELGALLARIHATPFQGVDAATPIARAIGRDVEAFVADEVAIALSYADLHQEDHALFIQAWERLGPRLGLRMAEGEAPSPAIEAFLGTPWPVPQPMDMEGTEG